MQELMRILVVKDEMAHMEMEEGHEEKKCEKSKDRGREKDDVDTVVVGNGGKRARVSGESFGSTDVIRIGELCQSDVGNGLWKDRMVIRRIR